MLLINYYKNNPNSLLLDNKDNLLNFINDLYESSNVSFNKGILYTNINFIENNILKDIEDYWYKKNNEKLKWFDPAAGVGNYIFFNILQINKWFKIQNFKL